MTVSVFGVVLLFKTAIPVTKGWSQEALAFECELDRTYVSAVERARWNVSLSNIERFALALGLEPWVLLKSPSKTEDVD